MEREQATRFIHELLQLMVKERGSDLFITAAFPPAIKVDGKITPVSKTAMTSQHTIELVRSVMNDKQRPSSNRRRNATSRSARPAWVASA